MRFTRVVLFLSLLALVVVPAALAIRFTDESYFMPTGVVGQSYSKQFDGAGGCGPALPYQYKILSGNLPPGLSLSFRGLISGTPQRAGSWSFWVDLSDQNPPSADWCRPADAQREFTITVVAAGGAPAPPPPPPPAPPAPAPLSIDQTALSPKVAVANTAYATQFTAHGGASQSWSVESGALPAGLSLSSAGKLSGTPTAAGDFTFRVRVTDGATSAAQTYTLSVVEPLAAAPVPPQQAEVGLPLRVRLAATGGRAPYRWAADEGTKVPAGVSLDPATGVLAGDPTAAGSFPLKLTVTDAFGLTSSLQLVLAVAPKVAVTTRVLPRAKAHRSFTAQLGARGGVAPRTWRILRGSLPAGLHLTSGTGRISGTPGRAGTATVVVQVTDALGGSSRQLLQLRVRR